MTRADTRPRVHLWPAGDRPSGGTYWTYSLSPTALRQGGGISAGEELDRALASLGARAAGGAVVIIEPVA